MMAMVVSKPLPRSCPLCCWWRPFRCCWWSQADWPPTENLLGW